MLAYLSFTFLMNENEVTVRRSWAKEWVAAAATDCRSAANTVSTKHTATKESSNFSARWHSDIKGLRSGSGPKGPHYKNWSSCCHTVQCFATGSVFQRQKKVFKWMDHKWMILIIMLKGAHMWKENQWCHIKAEALYPIQTFLQYECYVIINLTSVLCDTIFTVRQCSPVMFCARSFTASCSKHTQTECDVDGPISKSTCHHTPLWELLCFKDSLTAAINSCREHLEEHCGCNGGQGTKSFFSCISSKNKLLTTVFTMWQHVKSPYFFLCTK